MNNDRTKAQLIEDTKVLIEKYNDFVRTNDLDTELIHADISAFKKNVILSLNRGILDKLNRLKSKYYGK